jgi:hypothetical protein
MSLCSHVSQTPPVPIPHYSSLDLHWEMYQGERKQDSLEGPEKGKMQTTKFHPQEGLDSRLSSSFLFSLFILTFLKLVQIAKYNDLLRALPGQAPGYC